MAPGRNREQSEKFYDSSESLFSVYSKIAEDEDNKKTELWQKDAKGIFLFVSAIC